MSRQLKDRVDRRAIRQAVKEMLEELHLDFGKRVWKNRPRSFDAAELPAAIIYTRNETLEEANSAPRRYLRTLELVIEISAARQAPADGQADIDGSDDDQVDDYLDGLGLEVEKRLERDPTLGGLVDDCSHLRQEFETSDEGSLRFGFLRLFEAVTWTTEAPEEPESGLPPLRTVELRTRSKKQGGASTLDRVETLRP